MEVGDEKHWNVMRAFEKTNRTGDVEPFMRLLEGETETFGTI